MTSGVPGDPGVTRGRLLALTALPPWPCRDGYSVRAGHLLEELSRSWSITLVSPGTEESKAVAAPDGIEWTQLQEVPATNILPWREERGRLIEAARRTVAEESFDVALLWNGTEYVAGEIDEFPPAVADRIDCETLQAWRSRKHRWWGMRRKLQELRRGVEMAVYERRVLQPVRALVVTTPTDARALSFVTGHDEVVVVPNGVALPQLSEYPEETDAPRVIFTGVLGFPPNVEAIRYFLREVWPHVHGEIPESDFVIAGRSPVPESLRAVTERPDVILQSDVPDITTELRRAWVAVAPMQSGGGVKNKVLEAWAAGRPVVMSEMATSGLSLDDHTADLVTTSAGDMASTLRDLLVNERLRRKMGRRGRKIAHERHSWSEATRRLTTLLGTISTYDEEPTQAEIKVNS